MLCCFGMPEQLFPEPLHTEASTLNQGSVQQWGRAQPLAVGGQQSEAKTWRR
jgi:hypothetical protein